MKDLLDFYQQNFDKLLSQLGEHLFLTTISVLLACLISLPAGILIARRQSISGTVLNLAGILQTIPSIALLGFLIPILGIGMKPAIFALFLYSLLPIIRNVYTGINGIDPNVKESAVGMGMSRRQILLKVELPLALPSIFAGIRIATVINVGVATLAAYIAAGGLGEFIFGGIALNNSTMIFAGALPAALLAISLDFLLGRLQKLSNRRQALINTGLGLLVLLGISATARPHYSLLKAGYAPEFTGRSDGLPALRQTYDLKMPNVVLGPGLMYHAIHENYVDVISGYSTDGRIKSFQLRVLADDKKAFPPYQAGLLIRSDLLEQHPELQSCIALLEGRINDSLMTHLNYLVDHHHQSVEEVARAFLRDQQLYRPPGKGKRELIIGSKIFTEQYILSSIYQQLIAGHTDFILSSKNGLGGSKICFDALTAGEIDMYPEYSGTALQVLLQMPKPSELNNAEIYTIVQEELLQRYRLTLSEPLGFNNTYALMMREQHANQLNIKSISDLGRHLNSQ